MGGGFMRAAAKVAGIGSVVHSGVLRGSTVPTGHSVRKTTVPVAATLMAQNVGLANLSPIEKPALEATNEFVDWHLVGSENEELMMPTGDSMPRVVFDAAPSFQEAKEATTALKDALDKVYLSSPKSSDYGELSAADNKEAGWSLILNPEPEEMESLLTTRTAVPKHALQAFEMLSRSPEAQNVVASIASDPNIWNAMMENSAVQQYMDSNKSYNLYSEQCVAVAEFSDPVSSEKHEEKSFSLEDALSGFVQKVKLTVDKWVNDFSTSIQKIFEPPAADIADGEDNGTKKMIASGFMGLALMVVMVVLMKRV